MPKLYTPKVRYLTSERIDKIAKDAVADCKQDRDLALEAYRYFKSRVEGEIVNEGGEPAEATSTDKQLMLEALKIVQSAKKDVLRIMDIFSKAMVAVAKDKVPSVEGKPSFEDLDAITNDGN